MYAPYFGLDISTLRKWFESQFTGGLTWNNFGDSWQFSHIIPLSYFDQANDEDLRLCWNFINLRIEPTVAAKPGEYRLDTLGAKNYFTSLYEQTGYPIAKELEHKLTRIEEKEVNSSLAQQSFLAEHKDYLSQIKNYAAFQFELLNHGQSIEDINKEVALLNKNVQP